jgi:hypothetical protein
LINLNLEPIKYIIEPELRLNDETSTTDTTIFAKKYLFVKKKYLKLKKF